MVCQRAQACKSLRTPARTSIGSTLCTRIGTWIYMWVARKTGSFQWAPLVMPALDMFLCSGRLPFLLRMLSTSFDVFPLGFRLLSVHFPCLLPPIMNTGSALSLWIWGSTINPASHAKRLPKFTKLRYSNMSFECCLFYNDCAASHIAVFSDVRRK